MGLFDLFKKKEVDELGNPIEPNSNNEINSEFASAERYANVNSSDFCLRVEDIFTITGRGTVVTGVIESGSIEIGDDVVIHTQKRTKYSMQGNRHWKI